MVIMYKKIKIKLICECTSGFFIFGEPSVWKSGRTQRIYHLNSYYYHCNMFLVFIQRNVGFLASQWRLPGGYFTWQLQYFFSVFPSVGFFPTSTLFLWDKHYLGKSLWWESILEPTVAQHQFHYFNRKSFSFKLNDTTAATFVHLPEKLHIWETILASRGWRCSEMSPTVEWV